VEKSYLKNRDDANHLIAAQKPPADRSSRARSSAFILTLDELAAGGYLNKSYNVKKRHLS